MKAVPTSLVSAGGQPLEVIPTMAVDQSGALMRGAPDAIAAIAAGEIDGWRLGFPKFGRCSNVSAANLPMDVWNGAALGQYLYPGFPASAAQITVTSSVPASDNATGIGARTIFVQGLDANYNEISETLTIGGAASSQSFLRLHTASVITSGSSLFNVGVLICQQVGGGAIFFEMPTGRNQTNVAAYTIPAGYTGYITHFAVGARGGQGAQPGYANIEFYERDFGRAPRYRRPLGASSYATTTDDGVIIVPEKADVTARVTAVSIDGLDLIARFNVFLRRN